MFLFPGSVCKAFANAAAMSRHYYRCDYINVSSLVKILEGNGESPIFVQEVTEMKLNLYRDKTQDAQVSNLTIFGYALPSIVIFVLLAVLIVDPFIGSLGILQYAWWLVLILIISAPVVFFRALKKGGVLKKAKLLLSAEHVFPYAQRERYYKKYQKSVEYKEVD